MYSLTLYLRRDLVFAALYQQVKMSARNWRKFERSLSNERGPWRHKDEEPIFLKLDKYEDQSRQRKRLKRNFKGVDHSDSTLENFKSKATKQVSAAVASQGNTLLL
jgi:hypothetical protein